MRWTAALIARQATDRRQQAFIQELRRALGNATRLSAMEAVEVLIELAIDEPLRYERSGLEVIEQLQG